MATGEIRSELDVDKVNRYIAATVKEIKSPVEVKQFKVGHVCPLQNVGWLLRQIYCSLGR